MNIDGLQSSMPYQNFDVASSKDVDFTDIAASSKESSASALKTADLQTKNASKTSKDASNEEVSLNEQQKQAIEEKMTQKAVANANNRVKNMEYNNIRFNYNDDIDRVVISIVDQNTNKTVKEIPSEDTVKMLERLHTFHGLMVDESR